MSETLYEKVMKFAKNHDLLNIELIELNKKVEANMHRLEQQNRQDHFTLKVKLNSLKHSPANKKTKKILDQILLTDDGKKLIRYEEKEPEDEEVIIIDEDDDILPD